MTLKLTNNELLMPEIQFQQPTANFGGQFKQTKIQPIVNGNFGIGCPTPLETMEFKVASENCGWDGGKTRLEFDLSCGSTGCMASGYNPFKTLRVLTQSGVVLVDEQHLNLMTSINHQATISNENKALRWDEGLEQMNLADDDQFVLTPAPRRFSIELPSGFFKKNKIIPLPVSGGLSIFLGMERDAVALNLCSVASPYYIVQNPVLSVCLVPYEFNYLQQIKALAKKGGCLLNYPSYYHQSATTTSTSNIVSVSYGMKSARSVVAVHRLSSELGTRDFQKLGKFLFPSITSIQVSHGSDNYPYSAMTNAVAVYGEMIRTFNLNNDIDAGNQITRANYIAANITTGTDGNQSSTGPKFIVAIDLTKGGQMNTGISTINSPIAYKIECAATASLQTDCFISYDVITTFKSPTEAYVNI